MIHLFVTFLQGLGDEKKIVPVVEDTSFRRLPNNVIGDIRQVKYLQATTSELGSAGTSESC